MKNTLSELYEVKRGADKEIIIAPKNSKHECTLVWLHGLGDSAEGFLPFFYSEDSPAPSGCKVILLNAPMVTMKMYGNAQMRAWFEVVDPSDASQKKSVKADIKATMEKIKLLIAQEASLLSNNLKKMFIGGFSQGCMMSLLVGFEYGSSLGGIVGLSGMLLNPAKIPSQLPPILLVHGTSDAVVLYDQAVASYMRDGFLERSEVSFYKVNGMDHSVHPTVIELVRTFLLDNLKQ